MMELLTCITSMVLKYMTCSTLNDLKHMDKIRTIVTTDACNVEEMQYPCLHQLHCGPMGPAKKSQDHSPLEAPGYCLPIHSGRFIKVRCNVSPTPDPGVESGRSLSDVFDHLCVEPRALPKCIILFTLLRQLEMSG